MTTRHGLATAVPSKAEFFLLDEVLAVGNQSFRLKCTEKIDSLMKEGKTFVIISHDHNCIKKFSDLYVYEGFVFLKRMPSKSILKSRIALILP